MNWQLQDAKNKLSQVIDMVLSDGPQVITRRGKEVAVILPVKDYKQMKESKCDLVDFFRKSPLVGRLTYERNKDSSLRKVAL